jgi:micrococcal nuclease
MRLLAALALLTALPAAAAPLTGRVVGVTDGDTITVLVNGHDEVKVRLHGVDCPERGQAFGSRAKQFTSELCFGQTVTVRATDTDRFGRTIGEVITANGTNINVALVENGLGWWYEKYAPGDARFRDAQQRARAVNRGLWADPGAIPPWEYRSRNRDTVPGDNAVRQHAAPAPQMAQPLMAVPQPGIAPRMQARVVPEGDGGFWLTRSSNKRHNSGCKHYRNTNGRPCGADEGIPCKICGG